MLVVKYTASHNTISRENVCFGASNSVQYVHVREVVSKFPD